MADDYDAVHDAHAAPDYAPDISRGLPAEVARAMGEWARQRSARAAVDAEAWGGQLPAASHEDWLTEGHDCEAEPG